MKKYLNLLKYEMKTLIKDSMNRFMIFYPLLMLFIIGYLLPKIVQKTTSGIETAGAIYTLLIGFVMALAIGGYVMGAMLGFSLLENKDEKTILSIAVTPITVEGYATFKITYTYVFAIISNLIILGGAKLFASNQYVIDMGAGPVSLFDNISYLHILIFAIVNSLLVPAIALIFAAFAKNKVEGFAFMKGGGMIIMTPLLAIIPALTDVKQYILGIIPNFWAIKAMLNLALNSSEPSNLNFYIYLVIGAVYSILISVVSLKFFIKKSELK
jgi:fluoroquinolone transport system permease protein